MGYLLAGGAALLVSDLIGCPTKHFDLFAAAPVTSATAAEDALIQALRHRDYGVVPIQSGPMFSPMIVTRAGEETFVDLAVDSRPLSRPTLTVLGWVCGRLRASAGESIHW